MADHCSLHSSHPSTPLLLYDTLSRTTKPIVASDGNHVRIYACGPTIYDRAHIGNFRTFLFEDLLRRTLLLLGYRVKQVMNLTDVDDKTIRGAKKAGVSLQEFTSQYEKAFFEDLESLRIQKIEHYPKATHYIDHMIAMIQALEKKSVAYTASDGSVYFRIQQSPEYGKLSHLDLHDLQEGASGRVSSDEYEKLNVSDFVLWKAYDMERDGDVFWESPWGKGRPGWHIECSVMARELLGDSIDLHLGGVDLIFPHHENEIAQSEACSGCTFSHHWAHAEHLLVDHKKMSKSLGNFYTLQTILDKGFSPSSVRFLLLSSHYRTQMNFTIEGLESADASLKRIRDCLYRLETYTPRDTTESELEQWLDNAQHRFIEALCNDLNTSEALACLFDAIRKINSSLDKAAISSQDKEKALQFFSTVDSIFDIIHPDDQETVIPSEIQVLANRRQEARAEKNWQESDRLRNEIVSLGYIVEDTPQGQKISKASHHVAKVDHKR